MFIRLRQLAFSPVTAQSIPSESSDDPRAPLRTRHRFERLQVISCTSSQPCRCSPWMTPQSSPPPPTLATMAPWWRKRRTRAVKRALLSALSIGKHCHQPSRSTGAPPRSLSQAAPPTARGLQPQPRLLTSRPSPTATLCERTARVASL